MRIWTARWLEFEPVDLSALAQSVVADLPWVEALLWRHWCTIEFTLGSASDLFLDTAEWGKGYGYRAEVANKVHHNDLTTLLWLGRSANAAAFGKAWDTWRDARPFAAVAGAAVYFWRHSVLLTLLVGMAVYLPLHLGLGW